MFTFAEPTPKYLIYNEFPLVGSIYGISVPQYLPFPSNGESGYTPFLS